jgi:glutaminyl-peptide cyclotransferase
MNRFKLTFQGKNTGLSILLMAVATTLLIIGIGLLIDTFCEGVFDGKRALKDIETQLTFGPRTPGSNAHQQTEDWILSELETAGWQVEEQRSEVDGHAIRNLIAKHGTGTPWIILGAHYDSRFKADQDEDPAARDNPVPGANDGASGVALLLGLARALPQDLPGQVWLVFFDAEDQGNLPGWNWILGSRYFAEHLEGKPDGVVVVDMIGDADLHIYRERSSDPALTDAIWGTAAAYGYDKQFQPTFKYNMLDDHLPFLELGIPASLLIDFDYPQWHTATDTLDKVSAESLDVVGTTLYQWLVDMTGK